MKDIMLGTNGDALINNADLVIGKSNEQHKEHLIVTEPATLIEDVSIGIGAESFINSDNVDGLVAKVNEQFVKDGMSLTKINYNEQTGDITEDANYNS